MICTRDGRRAYVGCNDGTIRILDLESGEERGRLEGHDGCIHCLALSPDETQLVSGGTDTVVHIWSLRDKRALQCRGHTSDVEAVAFSADGQWVSSVGADRVVRVWDARAGTQLRALEGHTGRPTSVAVSPDNKWIASAGEDPSIRVWSADDGKLAQKLGGHSGVGREGEPPAYDEKVAFLPDSGRLASVGLDGKVILWNPVSGKQLHRYDLKVQTWLRLAASPDGRLLAVSVSESEIRVLRLP